jgi:hypothetical protein
MGIITLVLIGIEALVLIGIEALVLIVGLILIYTVALISVLVVCLVGRDIGPIVRIIEASLLLGTVASVGSRRRRLIWELLLS